MNKVVIYTTKFCPYCIRAKQLLDSKNAKYQEIKVDNNQSLRAEMMKKSKRRTVPQIWIGNKHVGGCDDLLALERADKLDTLLKTQ